MKIVLQRVKRASVTVSGECVAEIGPGLLLFLGCGENDTEQDGSQLLKKALNLRIFSDESGKFQFSALDRQCEILIVSQFTLLADCDKGRRPDFSKAMAPDSARALYEFVCANCAELLPTKQGVFGAHMEVELVNDGPVTILLES